jgi:hypothetical protein
MLFVHHSLPQMKGLVGASEAASCRVRVCRDHGVQKDKRRKPFGSRGLHVHSGFYGIGKTRNFEWVAESFMGSRL